MGLQRDYQEILKYDAEIIAISTDPPSLSLDLALELKLDYPLLSDPQHEVIERYGVYDLAGDGLATPSVFIVDQGGRIVWSYIGRDIADRPPNKVIIDQLRDIS